MRNSKLLHWWKVVVVGLVASAIFFPVSALAAPPSPLVPASESAAKLSNLFYIIMAIAVVIFVFVEGLLIVAVVRYRRRSEDEVPPQIHGNNLLEALWTIVPAGIMVSLFVISFPVMQEQYAPPASNPLTIQVTGHQWYWEFKYSESGIVMYKEFVIPVDRPVLLEIRSVDVIHSFWVPQFAGKKDAIPGHINELWFQVDKAGVYDGQCAEYCGLEHYAMLFKVTALEPAEFDAWLAEEIRKASEFQPVGTEITTILPAGNAATGSALYTSMGCAACHTLDGTTLVGPSFKGLGNRAASRKPGYSATLYLHESIVQPCAHGLPGFTCVMPQDFGDRLSAQDLADLIAFLQQQ
jgi:cytochrome c oxidase subunit 2